MKNFLKYLSTVFVLSFLCITGVFADTFNPSSALQYYEYYQGGVKQENSVNYGNNIILGSSSSINYPYAMSLILYGNYLQDKTYTLNVNVDTYFETNYFKFYYENLNYLIVSAQIVSGSERTLCNLQPITQNQKYSIGCTFKPTTNLSQVVLSLINYDYQNNGYVPFGSGDYVKFTNYNMAVYDNSSNIIIDQNNTIINQNNQNTQQIIDSSASNTQTIIDSNKVCKVYDNTDTIKNKTINDNGVVQDSNSSNVSDYIEIDNNSELYLLNKTQNIVGNFCFYNVNKTKISCTHSRDISVGQITIPNNASYFRYTISITEDKPTYKICENGSQALNSSINELDDTLKDDDTSVASSEASEFFSSFNTETFGLTSIITAPLNLIQSVLSTSCSDLQLPLPYLNNQYLTLPCMTSIYTQHFGTFFTIYQTITYGIIAYWVCVRIFNQVKDFKNPEHDEIEVMDL